MTLTMYDSITTADLPAGGDAYLAYASGGWDATPTKVAAKFPGKRILATATQAKYDAEMLDIEKGDATIAEAPGWTARQLARGVYRPVLYTSQGNLAALLSALTGAKLARSQVRILSSHYGHGQHICGPAPCKAPYDVDGTQWAAPAYASPGHYDISLLRDDFFAAPTPDVQEDDMPPILFNCPGTLGVWVLFSTGAYMHVPAPADEGALLDGGAKGPGKNIISQQFHDQMVAASTALLASAQPVSVTPVSGSISFGSAK